MSEQFSEEHMVSALFFYLSGQGLKRETSNDELQKYKVVMQQRATNILH